MGKRTAPDAELKASHDARHVKRQRVENSAERNSPRPSNATVEVTSARQLQKALVFDQGAASGFRSGLTLLKGFLDSILYSTDHDDLPRKRAILREYLDSQKSRINGEKNVVFLPDFFQAWDFAAETNFDMLLSQVTANLALLLKVCASTPDLLEYGALLCKSVLNVSVAKRINRSLSAPAHKENVISPVLRLLTEMTRFNEGAHAKAVYSKRDFTLDPKILTRNIALWKDYKADVEAEKRKPSIRTHAVRYLLAHLTYQDEVDKTEILSNSIVVRAVFTHLHADPPALIFDILNTFENHVFLDKAIMRITKSRIVTGKTLSDISKLYRYEASEEEGSEAIAERAHKFLCMICTSPAHGVMLPSYGYYPPPNEDDDEDLIMEDAGEPAYWAIDAAETQMGRVRNVILGEFIQSLRPHASVLQQELLLTILKVCPELVAAYFFQKEAFNYEPKLTSTWIGYTAFLHQAIELPIPKYFGGKDAYRPSPPAVSSVIQSILPQPLTQQVLTKCLNSSTDLINLFAIRLLTVAFHKLRSVLQEYSAASASKVSRAWRDGSTRLVAEFCRRCPPMKVIIQAFRRPTFQKDMMREAIVRLLRLYYEVIPLVALQEKFDVSVPLCNALLQADKPSESHEDKAFRVLELEHWLQVARRSSSIRWWQKNKSLPNSPFTVLLKLVATSHEGEMYEGVKSLLSAIQQDQDMLQMRTHPTALDAVIASLAPSCGSSAPPTQILEFLDDCCARFVRSPIKYLDDLDTMRFRLLEKDGNTGSFAPFSPQSDLPFSPLLMTLVEQWPFKGGKPEKGNPAEPLAQWLAKLLYLLKLVGEDETLLEAVRDSLVSSADPAYQQVLKDSFSWKMAKEKAKEALKSATGADFSGSERSNSTSVQPEQASDLRTEAASVDLMLPPEEDEKHAGLNRWRRKEIDEAIDDGDVGELLLCLCSKHTEIRLQAVSNIQQLMAKIDASGDEHLLQHKILLGEVLETATPIVNNSPFPYVGGVFAARCVPVLADPSHFMFVKVNTFLMKRPEWTVENLPRYWGRNTITTEATDDGSYHREVDWYLDYLFDSLRTPEDMEIFRTRNVFERLLTHYASASCSAAAKERIIKLLLRAAAVGGSTTLVTRCGVVDWIKMRLDDNDRNSQMLRLVAKRIWETFDKEKVEIWSGGTMERCMGPVLVDSLA
ncbi:uncharacterized protein EI97DRAFT_436422 [Westerdykella ornata]|uniref:Ribosome biogenesis protein Urb1 n=1 Tax=Westerdykella ornata TaxID=318751 RepID=A0A6A6J9H3_WESOR|nr:uncharacterized protein EI97DRAFT_436422 [Westerdykella ornata]KAF2272985.1 hypothetical protein EI97DRAFT_436422 [Westerdykella ornata]